MGTLVIEGGVPTTEAATGDPDAGIEALTIAGPPWETYLTDPGEHPDPETWETEIVQPITDERA
jgi:hypothetical protein